MTGSGTPADRAGINPRGLIALVPSGAIGVAMVVVPALSPAFSWFGGTLSAAVVDHLVADRRRTSTEVTGEHLARTTASEGIR